MPKTFDLLFTRRLAEIPEGNPEFIPDKKDTKTTLIETYVFKRINTSLFWQKVLT